MVSQENKKLVWLDLEMTGLDPHNDSILEAAVVITDNNLTVLSESPTYRIKTDPILLERMHKNVKALHTASGLLDLLRHATQSVSEIEQELLTFLNTHCQPHSVPLCGNSIWMDKLFLLHHMPALYTFFHYRTIDVSSLKELIQRWYPDSPYKDFKKKKNHRALDDIYESIAELAYYKKHFLKEFPN